MNLLCNREAKGRKNVNVPDYTDQATARACS